MRFAGWFAFPAEPGNRGVDVVLNMLPGRAIQQGLNCLAPSGRYLEIAVQALKASERLDNPRVREAYLGEGAA